MSPRTPKWWHPPKARIKTQNEISLYISSYPQASARLNRWHRYLRPQGARRTLRRQWREMGYRTATGGALEWRCGSPCIRLQKVRRLENAHRAVTAPVRLAVFLCPPVPAGCVANTRPPRGKYVTPSLCGFQGTRRPSFDARQSCRGGATMAKKALLPQSRRLDPEGRKESARGSSRWWDDPLAGRAVRWSRRWPQRKLRRSHHGYK